MIFKSIATAKNLHGKTALVRIDTNVPLLGKKVLDDSRLKEAVSTIRFLEKRGAKIILLGHLGRPKGKFKSELSLKPIGYALGKLLRQPVRVMPLSSSAEVIKQATAQGLVLLENIRFDKGEDINSSDLAKRLAGLGQIYVNEAFSCSHRQAASIVALPSKLSSFAGLGLVHEVEALEKVRRSGRKPVLAIIGGAKISDKLPVIAKLLPRLKAVLVGGGVANNFLKAKGYKIGRSLYSQAEVKIAKSLLRRAGKKIILPVDVLVDQPKTKQAEAWLKKVNAISFNDKIVDIGIESCIIFSNYLKKAGTIFWSGPLGLVEEPNWRHATLAIGRLVSALARRRVYVVVGGGDTTSFFYQHSLSADYFSTGGSAMLAFLAGEKLPGLAALGYYQKK